VKLKELAQWAEIIASVAVVVSLVVLIVEIRDNTRAIEGESIKDRSALLNDPFVNSALNPSILAKIKKVDGWEPLEATFTERYGLTYEEAAIWARNLSMMWTGYEAQFISDGPTPELIETMQLLLQMPDNKMYWQAGAIQIRSAEFRTYVASLEELPPNQTVLDYIRRIEDLKVQ
jgi:hypothetical protein